MPDDLDGAVAADADLEDGLGRGPLFLPGDRKTFHAEDSLMLDCDGDLMGMDDCSSLTGFEPFFPGGRPHRFLDQLSLDLYRVADPDIFSDGFETGTAPWSLVLGEAVP